MTKNICVTRTKMGENEMCTTFRVSKVKLSPMYTMEVIEGFRGGLAPTHS
jgi:hypothetical protein